MGATTTGEGSSTATGATTTGAPGAVTGAAATPPGTESAGGTPTGTTTTGTTMATGSATTTGATGTDPTQMTSATQVPGDDIVFDVQPVEMEDCDNVLDVVYRDFDETHPDMERQFPGDEVRLQLIEPTLDANRKPIFRDSAGCARGEDDPTICHEFWMPTEAVIESEASFNQWYNTVEGVNIEIPGELELVETPVGSGVYVFDSTDFFPLGPDEGYGISPPNHHLMRNFFFTTEIHFAFQYVAGQTFSFRGDDDLWIFVNGRLAMDLGSMHEATEGIIDFDAQAAALGIAPGGTYAMDIFHAERHTLNSNFRFTTNIRCFIPAVIR